MAQESYKREQEAGCQPPDGPIRCAKNCGFFGNAATSNMCSKCYRDHVLQQTKHAAQASAAAAVMASQATAAACGDLSEDIEMEDAAKAGESDFMSGVKVLAGLAAEENASPLGSSTLPGTIASSASSSFPHPSLPLPGKPSPPACPSFTSPSAASAAVGPTSSTTPVTATAPTPQPNRCAACKKKVGLTGFKCRCNSVFCSLHRYSDKHSCSFDYKAAAREAIAKANPVVRGTKIEKI